jgi:hypothetical protein
VSHEEVNDLVRFAPTPAEGAKRVLSFAETIGSEDNATLIVIPLLGWGKPQGVDTTKELREYKENQAGELVPVPSLSSYLTGILPSRQEKNVIDLFEVVMLFGRTDCTLYVAYSVHRPLSNTHPWCELCPAAVERRDT